MSFPLEEEKLLKKTMYSSVKPIIDYIEKNRYKNITEKELDDILETYIEKFIDNLSDSIVNISKFTKKEWEKSFKKNLPNPINEKKSIKWIEDNLRIYSNFPDKILNKLNVIRFERQEELRVYFNRVTDLKLDTNDFTKSELEYLKRMLKSNISTKEYSKIRTDFENLKVFTENDINNLKKWSKRYSELWARDQAGDMYAMNCEELAVLTDTKYFIWHTEQDNRVRPSHRILNGKKISFASAVFLPGQEPLCRCHMTPVVNN